MGKKNNSKSKDSVKSDESSSGAESNSNVDKISKVSAVKNEESKGDDTSGSGCEEESDTEYEYEVVEEKKPAKSLLHSLLWSEPAKEEVTLRNIETGDTMKVKQVLDESIVLAMEDLRYTVNYNTENIKLILMALACVMALGAQFHPGKFPENRFIIGAFVCSYFALSGILQLIESFVEGDRLLRTARSTIYEKSSVENEDGKDKNSKDKDSKDSTSKVEAKEKLDLVKRSAIDIHTIFEKYSEWYKILLIGAGVSPNDESVKQIVRGDFYVGKYFTAMGDFDEKRFHTDVKAHFTRFESEKYGTYKYDHKSD